MPFDDEPFGVVAPKNHTTTYEKFLAVVLLLILLALFGNFAQSRHQINQNDTVLQVQADGVIRGYISRAISCDLAKSIGADEPTHCDDEVIQPYRDKDLTVGSTTSAKASRHTLEVVCAIVMQSEVATPAIKNICLSS